MKKLYMGLMLVFAVLAVSVNSTQARRGGGFGWGFLAGAGLGSAFSSYYGYPGYYGYGYPGYNYGYAPYRYGSYYPGYYGFYTPNYFYW